MNYTFQLAWPFFLYAGLCVLACAMFYRLKLRRPLKYRYPLVSLLQLGSHTTNISGPILFLLRSSALTLLILLLARPHMVDVDTTIHVEGIDIMIVLDVSNSMQLFDDINDRRARIEVAKAEAIKFVEKRDNDQIGLVIFGQDAVSRCPLTLDKLLLKKIIQELQLGVINPDGTVLAKGIVTALNRLKHSHAATKVIILLTDGDPTPELDIPITDALSIAKQLGVKIYTIGIGGEQGGLLQDPIFGVRAVGFKMNKQLLDRIAHETGAMSFLAQKPQDLERIYSTIDQLEKSEYETTLYKNYYDIYMPFLVTAIALFAAELVASTLVWFIV